MALPLKFPIAVSIAGLATHYRKDEQKNKQVIVLANLKPVKLMGVESRGMILAG